MHIEKFRFAKSFCPVFLTSPLVDWPLFPVRAYVLSSGLNPENLVRAETALDELLDSIPPDDVSTHSPPLLFGPNVAPAKGRRESRTALVETSGP